MCLNVCKCVCAHIYDKDFNELNNDLYASVWFILGCPVHDVCVLFYELSIMHVCPWSYEIYYVLFFHHAKVILKS